MNAAHTVAGAAAWSLRLPRGHALRLDCLADGANASMLAYAAADPVERLNIPDTLKAQMSGCVRPPMVNVPVTVDGGLSFEDGLSAPGKYVELRAERDILVLISNCPQINNPCNGYDPTPVRLIGAGC